MHQALPFVDVRYGFKENRLLWMYQNVIARAIFVSIRFASKVIVQAEWLKHAAAKKGSVQLSKIAVVRPALHIDTSALYDSTRQNRSTFFYPASAYVYKNHQIIFEACELLKKQGITDYHVVLTLYGNEDQSIRAYAARVAYSDLPVQFVGTLSREEVFGYYIKSVLIFPSLIESFPLPLWEAALHGSPIIAADTLSAREILTGYPNAHFFNGKSALDLAENMRRSIGGDIPYIEGAVQCRWDTTQTLIEHVVS